MIQGSPVCSAYDALQPFLSIQDFTQDQGFHPVANRKPPLHAALVSVQGETVPPATLEGSFIGLERMQSFALEQAHARLDFDPTSLLRAGAPATAANDTTVLLTKPAAKRCVADVMAAGGEMHQLRLKRWSRFALSCFLIAIAGPSVAGCRVADSAARGGQAAFDRAQSAAQAIASNEHSAQTALQKCLSSITVRTPSNMFPSLGDVFGQLVQKVCYAVSDEVNHVTSQIDLTSQINAAIADINSQAGASTGGWVTNPLTGGDGSKPVSLIGGGGSTTGAGSSADFWSTVWK